MGSIPLQEKIIYGPVNSRRLGSSLGINLSPRSTKSCSFDCVYCQYGPTKEQTNLYDKEMIPQPADVYRSLRRNLRMLSEDPSYITFSGNGEPTCHPDFPEIVEEVKKIRDEYSKAEIAVLSNASRVVDEEIRNALSKTDLPILKLDVGSPEKFEEVNRPLDIGYHELVESVKKVENSHLQSLKFRGEINNVEEDLKDWMEVVEDIQPEGVQLYTLDRPTPRNLSKAEEKELKDLARSLRNRGIKAEVYP